MSKRFSLQCVAVEFYVISQNVFRNHVFTTQITIKICWKRFSPRCGIFKVIGCIRICTVNFQMHSQIACLNISLITRVAFVWLFSTVCFQMCPQITFLGEYKVALVAFIWLLTVMSFRKAFSNCTNTILEKKSDPAFFYTATFNDNSRIEKFWVKFLN